MEQEQEQERELGWDDEISRDGDDFIVLPPGEYPFRVKMFERGRHNGSEKLPPCNVAKLSVEIDGSEKGKTIVWHRIHLHSITEGMICQFFRAIGARKAGQSLRMNWSAVPGATGRCKVGIREYNDKKYNEIKTFLDPIESSEQKSGWQAGAF